MKAERYRECKFKPGDRVTIVDCPSEVMDGVDSRSIAAIVRRGAVVEDTHFTEVPNDEQNGWWEVDLQGYPYFFMECDLKLMESGRGQVIHVLHEVSKDSPEWGVP